MPRYTVLATPRLHALLTIDLHRGYNGLSTDTLKEAHAQAATEIRQLLETDSSRVLRAEADLESPLHAHVAMLWCDGYWRAAWDADDSGDAVMESVYGILSQDTVDLLKDIIDARFEGM